MVLLLFLAIVIYAIGYCVFEAGMKVIGISEHKAFISACDRFILLRFRWSNEEKSPKKIPKPILKSVENCFKISERDTSKPLNKELMNYCELIESTIDDMRDDDGWAFLGDVRNLIVKKKPEFDPRNYGFVNLHQ
jgi:hypothetical protein